MGYVTIEENGSPWVICVPEDQNDLNQFLETSKAVASGSLSYRQATPAEASRCAAARVLHLRQSGGPQAFFGIPA